MNKIVTVVCALSFIAGSACSGDSTSSTRDYTTKDLPHLILQESEAPKGAFLDATSSGERDLTAFADGNAAHEKGLAAAGFRDAYFAFFVSPDLFADGNINKLSPRGSLAFSFGAVFAHASGASKGLTLILQKVRHDGTGLVDRPAGDFGTEAFGLYGQLDKNLPPGFMFAWRSRNGIFGVVSAGAKDAIRESGARALAQIVAARTR